MANFFIVRLERSKRDTHHLCRGRRRQPAARLVLVNLIGLGRRGNGHVRRPTRSPGPTSSCGSPVRGGPHRLREFLPTAVEVSGYRKYGVGCGSLLAFAAQAMKPGRSPTTSWSFAVRPTFRARAALTSPRISRSCPSFFSASPTGSSSATTPARGYLTLEGEDPSRLAIADVLFQTPHRPRG